MYIFPFEFGKKAANTVELSSKKSYFCTKFKIAKRAKNLSKNAFASLFGIKIYLSFLARLEQSRVTIQSLEIYGLTAGGTKG